MHAYVVVREVVWSPGMIWRCSNHFAYIKMTFFYIYELMDICSLGRSLCPPMLTLKYHPLCPPAAAPSAIQLGGILAQEQATIVTQHLRYSHCLCYKAWRTSPLRARRVLATHNALPRIAPTYACNAVVSNTTATCQGRIMTSATACRAATTSLLTLCAMSVRTRPRALQADRTVGAAHAAAPSCEHSL
eukprot:4075780-Pleurochrysis_carterae.AAC.2